MTGLNMTLLKCEGALTWDQEGPKLQLVRDLLPSRGERVRGGEAEVQCRSHQEEHPLSRMEQGPARSGMEAECHLVGQVRKLNKEVKLTIIISIIARTSTSRGNARSSSANQSGGRISAEMAAQLEDLTAEVRGRNCIAVEDRSVARI